MKTNLNFQLSPAAAPTARAVAGRRQRHGKQGLAYQVRDGFYNVQERLMIRWRARRNTLPKRTSATLGVPTVAAFLWCHRAQFRGIMQALGSKTARALLARYGRNGLDSWNFDHRAPIRHVDHFRAGDIARKFSHWNLRPRIADRNKARKYEPPADHAELDFHGKGAA